MQLSVPLTQFPVTASLFPRCVTAEVALTHVRSGTSRRLVVLTISMVPTRRFCNRELFSQFWQYSTKQHSINKAKVAVEKLLREEKVALQSSPVVEA